MALVPIWSVYWPNADKTGPDLDVMNRIVEVDEEVARQRAGNRFGDLPGDGTARWPTADELADWEAQKAVEAKAEDAADNGDLSKLKKDELVTLAGQRDISVPAGATKADIAALIEDAHTAGTTPDHTAAASADSVGGDPDGVAEPSE